MSNRNNTSGGIGLCGLLFIVFIVMKLAKIGVVASWSWWWVTAPLWAPTIAVLGIWAMLALVVGIFGAVSGGISHRRRLSRLMRE